MNTIQTKSRDDIPEKYKWKIDTMYSDEGVWSDDIDEAVSAAERFAEMSGHITDSPSSLLEALELYTRIMRKLEHAYVYSRMKHDENNADAKYSGMNSRAMSAMAKIYAMTAFFIPELLSSDTETVDEYAEQEPELRKYAHMLESTMLRRAHVLSAPEEGIMAALGEVTDAPGEAFTMLNNADMEFGTLTDDEGREVELTHGNFIQLLESDSRDVRRKAFEQLYREYKRLNNTISVLYHYNVKSDFISARLRHYDTTLEASLSGEKIPTAVYSSLIDAVHESLPDMHRYTALRKRSLGVDELHMYDAYKPLVKPASLECTYEEAVDIACEALKPLGSEYTAALRSGLLEQGWVDVMENKGKTSGAYSFGSYDSMPFILMNFAGRLNDIFTLIHEGGHSMHSLYTRRAQPFIYGSHSIFTAEVASTVNETLLTHYLLKNADTFEMKAYLTNHYIDQFKSTLFRQTMFAEFEKIAHETVEGGGSLSAEFLNSEYERLNFMYFGPEMARDDFIKYEWSRIPHFYRSYYVYQYATGFSAAQALAAGILNGGDEPRDKYLRFLTLGDSDYPIELLKEAGVDMSTPAAVREALSIFKGLVDNLEGMI